MCDPLEASAQHESLSFSPGHAAALEGQLDGPAMASDNGRGDVQHNNLRTERAWQDTNTSAPRGVPGVWEIPSAPCRGLPGVGNQALTRKGHNKEIRFRCFPARLSDAYLGRSCSGPHVHNSGPTGRAGRAIPRSKCLRATAARAPVSRLIACVSGAAKR